MDKKLILMKIFFLFSFAEKEKKYIFATELLLLTIHKQSSSKKIMTNILAKMFCEKYVLKRTYNISQQK